MATVFALGGFVLGCKRAGVIEGVAFFCAFVTILAPGRPLHFLVAGNAIPVHRCFKAWHVIMIYLRISFLDGGCREWIGLMAAPARDYLRLAAVPVTSDTVGFLHERPGGMMVAIGAFLYQLDMLGMIEIN